jgi:16S rRNA G527 N7-methylase RsmG
VISDGVPVSEALRAVLAGFDGGAYLPHVERIAQFFALRARWAAAHNLSGPKALRDPGPTDLADAAALAELADASTVLHDVGAGSGVPGALVALMRPDLTVIAIEPIAKRTAFLRQAIATLGLTNLSVDRTTWPIPLHRTTAVVSRAVFPVPDWPAAAAAGGEQVVTIYRYLARERPAFGAPGFERVRVRSYPGPAAPEHLLERWDRCV